MSNKLVKPHGNEIIVDDGSKEYTIKNKRGKVLGKFEFSPTDTNIVKRYEEVVEFYNSYQLPKNPTETLGRMRKKLSFPFSEHFPLLRTESCSLRTCFHPLQK